MGPEDAPEGGQETTAAAVAPVQGPDGIKLKFPTGDGVIPSLTPCATHEQFTTWLRDLESYFKCEQIHDMEKRYSMLMIHGGPFLNEIVKTVKENDRKVKDGKALLLEELETAGMSRYERTKRILVENYVPNSNVTVERMKFRATQPSVGDSHVTFLEKLQRRAKYCAYDSGYSTEAAIVEQFMDKCLWGNLKTRLSFETNLTIAKVIEIAEQMRRSMPEGKDLRFQKPGADRLYKSFPNRHSLEATKHDVYKPYKLEDLYDKKQPESVPDPKVPCDQCQHCGHVNKYCILSREKQEKES